jgi:hypothetical protein
MDYYSAYIKLIFVIKIAFIGLALYGIYIKRKEPNETKKIETIHYFKDRIEFIFKFLMSILLICLFNPRFSKENIKLDYETRLLLYLFGFIIILTADWNTFIKNTPKSLQMLQSILGANNSQQSETQTNKQINHK